MKSFIVNFFSYIIKILAGDKMPGRDSLSAWLSSPVISHWRPPMQCPTAVLFQEESRISHELSGEVGDFTAERGSHLHLGAG